MRLGIFARTFAESTLEGVLDAIVRHELKYVQFNLKCVGTETLPPSIDDELCSRVRSAFERHRLQMVAISCTFNTIDPNVSQREETTRRACHLIERARDLGTSFVTLCTGTCNPSGMWQPHPENDSREAWQALTVTLETLLDVAEAHGVFLGIEPEQANVINSSTKARRLLDDMQSKHLKVVLDGANLLAPGNLIHMRQILTQAFDLLGPDIALTHAKEYSGGPETDINAVGTGCLDWTLYLDLIRAIGFEGPLLLHGLGPRQVSESVAFLQQVWAR